MPDIKREVKPGIVVRYLSLETQSARVLGIITTIGIIQSTAMLLYLVRSKTMAVLLGPEGIGIIGIIDQSAYVVAQISAFGLSIAAVKFLSRSHSEGFDAFKRSYAGFLRPLLALTTSGTAISIGIVLLVPDLLGPELLAYRASFVLALLNAPNMAIQGFLMSTFSAARRARTSALIFLAAALALALGAYAGILLAGIPGLYAFSLLANTLVTLGFLMYARKRLGLKLFDRAPSIREEWRRHPDVVAFALTMYGSSFAYPLALLVARYAVLAGDGEAAAGLLHAAVTLSGALGLVLGQATSLYLMPILNRNIAREEKVHAALEFQRKLMLIVGAVAVPLVLFPQLALTVLFSPVFIDVSQVLFLFVVAQCILLLAGVYQALLIGLDDLKAYGVVAAIGYPLLGVCAWVLAPRYGIVGVAIGLLAASMAIFLLTLARLLLKHALTLPAGLPAVMGYGLLAVLLAGVLSNQFDAWSPLVVLGKAGLYFLFVGPLLFLSVRGPTENKAHPR